jgi:hypothetical protein
MDSLMAEMNRKKRVLDEAKSTSSTSTSKKSKYLKNSTLRQVEANQKDVADRLLLSRDEQATKKLEAERARQERVEGLRLDQGEEVSQAQAITQGAVVDPAKGAGANLAPSTEVDTHSSSTQLALVDQQSH